MDEQKKMEEILKGIREKNNDLQYQSILVATRFPNLPEEVKGLLTLYAIDHESNRALLRELGLNIVAKDKMIETLQELTGRQREIIRGYKDDH
jgi:hypothetical protein